MIVKKFVAEFSAEISVFSSPEPRKMSVWMLLSLCGPRASAKDTGPMLFKMSQNPVGPLGQNKCTKSCVEIFYINLHLVKNL